MSPLPKPGHQLDIGCGGNKQGPDWLGIDKRPLDGVDIVHDLEVFPWPLEDESVIRAIASHVIEHINPANGIFLRFMDEVWRVLKPDGQFAIMLPHGYSPGQMQDPSHINSSNEATWAYFDPLEPKTGGHLYRIYRPKPWELVKMYWEPNANMEILLRKRRDDYSYYE